MSIIKKYSITINGTNHLITVTCQRIKNDFKGNPQYLLQVWTSGNNGHLWYPKLKGYRDRKDESYKTSFYDINDGVERFVKDFESQLNERL